jgi:thioredoxin 1
MDQFNKEIAQVQSPLREMYMEEPQKLLEGIIVKALFLQEAKKQGLSAPSKKIDKDSLSPEESLVMELLKKKFPSPPEVTHQEIEGFYTIFKDQMDGKPLNQVAPSIKQIIEETKAREKFEEFVKELRNKAKVEIDQDRLKKMAAKPPESNTEEDFKKALISGKPALVDFGANSCVPCREMRPILKEVGKEYLDKVKVLVIDVYKYQNLAQQHQIRRIPTLIFFDSKGKEVHKHTGFMDKEKIIAKLKEIGMES